MKGVIIYNSCMKLWFKIIKGDKMIAHTVVENDEELNIDSYEELLPEACHKLDLSTPVSLVPHFNSLFRFHVTDYLPRDFVEPVDFTRLIVEDIGRDEKSKNRH